MRKLEKEEGDSGFGVGWFIKALSEEDLRESGGWGGESKSKTACLVYKRP